MLDKEYFLPADALRRIVGSLPADALPMERIPIEEAYTRVLASDSISPEDLPAFSRSTVDGFAVAAADTFGAKETSPAYISVHNEVFMGLAPQFGIKRGEAAKIPTGGMLPEGADAVVMLEYTQSVSPDMIEVVRSVALNENVIQRGEDVRKGEKVLSKGRTLRPQDIGALAGIGITEVDVYRKPKVSIISTGDEIVPPGKALQYGEVRDINSFTLSGLILEHGGIPVKKGIFRDEYKTIRKAMEESLRDSELVLISGGTSAGTKDMTAAIIDDLGTPGVLFHGAALKPGKPMIGGVVNGKAILGLPGHPAATVVCFDLFIKPLLEKLCGREDRFSFAKTVRAKMEKSIASAAGREDHIRISLQEREGQLFALPVLGKSGLITTLVKADGTVVIPATKLGLDAGEEVTVKLFQ